MKARAGWAALVFVVLLLFIGVADASAAPADEGGVVEAVWAPTASPPVVLVPLAVLPYEANYMYSTLNSNSETIPVLTDAEALAQLDIATRVSAPRISAMVNTGKRTIHIDRLYRGVLGRFRTGIQLWQEPSVLG